MWIDELIIKLNSKVKWRVSQKLTFLIGLLLISLLVTGISAIYTLNVFNSTFRKALDINIKRTLIASRMNDDLMRFDRLVVEYIRSRYQADRRKIEKELAQINQHFNASIQELKALKQDSTNNEILSELEPSWQEYDYTVQKILSKAEKNNLESAMELWDGWASVRYRDLKYLIREVINYNFELAQNSKTKASNSLQHILFWIVLIIVATSVLSIGLGVLIIRYLHISLHNLILANERVSRGHLSQGLDLAINYNSEDELAELAESNRKMVASIKKMVADVTAMTEKFTPDETVLNEEFDPRQLTDFINIEKTMRLVQDLTDSLELVKQEIGHVCTPELINPGLEEAHHRTLDTINNFNKGILKLHKLLANIGSIPETFNRLVEKYGNSNSAGDKKLIETLQGVEEISVSVVNAMEVIKFGLLDQKMLLDSRNNLSDGSDTNNYFVNLAKAIKSIIKQAEETSTDAQKLQQDLQQVVQTLKRINSPYEADSTVTAPEINEFKMLLDKLEGIMSSFSK